MVATYTNLHPYEGCFDSQTYQTANMYGGIQNSFRSQINASSICSSGSLHAPTQHSFANHIDTSCSANAIETMSTADNESQYGLRHHINNGAVRLGHSDDLLRASGAFVGVHRLPTVYPYSLAARNNNSLMSGLRSLPRIDTYSPLITAPATFNEPLTVLGPSVNHLGYQYASYDQTCHTGNHWGHSSIPWQCSQSDQASQSSFSSIASCNNSVSSPGSFSSIISDHPQAPMLEGQSYHPTLPMSIQTQSFTPINAPHHFSVGSAIPTLDVTKPPQLQPLAPRSLPIATQVDATASAESSGSPELTPCPHCGHDPRIAVQRSSDSRANSPATVATLATLSRTSSPASSQSDNDNASHHTTGYDNRLQRELNQLVEEGLQDRDSQDEYLLKARNLDMTYKEIATAIQESSQVYISQSTLRGRYRILTKPASQRPREPRWTEKDIELLLDGARRSQSIYANDSREGPCDRGIRWKDVVQFIIENGGSHKFGPATAKRKWLELKGAVFVQRKPAKRRKP